MGLRKVKGSIDAGIASCLARRLGGLWIWYQFSPLGWVLRLRVERINCCTRAIGS